MSKLALKLIAENKKTRATSINLGNCELKEVPMEIGELVWLEELILSTTWNKNENGEFKPHNTEKVNELRRLTPSMFSFTSIKRLLNGAEKSNPFSGLIKLKRLRLSGSFDMKYPLNDLSPLAILTNLVSLSVCNTQIDDLTPLLELINLRFLDVSDTQVTDLTPLAKLTNLEHLDISNTQVTDLTPLEKTSNLVFLTTSGTQVTDLTPLAEITTLRYLNIARTHVANLSPLTKLTNLTTLRAYASQVTNLSPLTKLTNLVVSQRNIRGLLLR